MNACRREDVSCGSCCGIYNLRLDAAGRRTLILDRSRRFESVDVTQASQMAAYRQERERAEEQLARFNEETYVCPFFGIPRGQTLAGCMIHPSITGNPHSQNFSFYGASICQAYDCPNKDRDPDGIYSEFARKASMRTGIEYGTIMSDTRLLNVLCDTKAFPARVLGYPEESGDALDAVLKARSEVLAAAGVASFEFRRFSDPALELADVLGETGARLLAGVERS